MHPQRPFPWRIAGGFNHSIEVRSNAIPPIFLRGGHAFAAVIIRPKQNKTLAGPAFSCLPRKGCFMRSSANTLYKRDQPASMAASPPTGKDCL